MLDVRATYADETGSILYGTGFTVPGSESAAVQVTTFEKPAVPVSVAVAPMTAADDELTVSWTAPAAVTPAVSGYLLRWRVRDANANQSGNQPGGWNDSDGVSVSGTSRLITGLSTTTAYDVQVRATNGVHSDWSAVVFGSTAPVTPTFTVAAGNTKLTVSYDASSISGRGAVVPKARWRIKDTDSTTSGNQAGAWLPTADGHAYSGSGFDIPGATCTGTGCGALVNGTVYEVQVNLAYVGYASGWQAAGDGTPAVPAVPAAPTGLTVEEGDETLGLGWIEPEGAVTGYDVHYTSALSTGNDAVANEDAASGSDPGAGWVANPDSVRWDTGDRIFDLVNRTVYRVRVRAKNSGGSGAWVFGSGTPKIILQWPGTGNQINEDDTNALQIRTGPGGSIVSAAVSGTLTYAAGSSNPASLSDDLTSGYATSFSFVADANPTIDLATAVNDSVNEQHETFTVTLNAGTNYTVGARNVVTLTIIDNDPPAAPSPLSLTAGDSKLTVSWTKPAGPVTGYQVRHKEASASDQAASTPGDPSTGWVTSTPSGTGTTAEIASLTNGTDYHVAVRATDGQTESGNGYGDWTGSQTGTPTAVTSPGVTLSTGTVSVAEGATATYTAVLDTQPSAPVTVTATSGTMAKATVSGALTFSTLNWGTAQSFTVTGVDAGTSAITHAATSTDSNYMITEVGTVTATVTATAAAPTALTLSTNANNNTVAENGGTVTVTATLDTAATSAVTVTLTATGTATSGSDYALPAAFSIPMGQTMATGTVSITDDDLDEGNETIILSTSVSGLTVTGVTVTVTDDDTHGVTVNKTSVSVVEDATATYTVVLDSQPTANVIVTPTSGMTAKATVMPTARTFTAGNWDTPQSFTVSGVDAGTSTVTHAATSSDTLYSGETVSSVTVTVSAAAAKTVSIVSAVSAVEGSDASVMVTLGEAAPSGGLLVSFAYDYSGSASVSDTGTTPVSLTVAAGATTATLSVPIAQDTLVENAESFTVTVSTAVAGWSVTSGSSEASVTIAASDRSGARIAFGTDAAATAAYAGSVGEKDFSVSVNVPVTVNRLPNVDTVFGVEVLDVGSRAASEYVSSSAPGDFRVATKSVTFGPSSALTQNVVVSVTGDNTVEWPETISLRLVAADDPRDDLGDWFVRHSLSRTATVTINDEEVDDARIRAGHFNNEDVHVIQIREDNQTPNQVGRDVFVWVSVAIAPRGAETFEIGFDRFDSSTATVGTGSGDDCENYPVEVDYVLNQNATFTFDAGRGYTSNKANIGYWLCDDTVVEGAEVIELRIADRNSVPSVYSDLFERHSLGSRVTIVIEDNEIAYGVTLSDTAKSVQTGRTTSYSVKLNRRPTADVVVAASSGTSTVATVTPAAGLTFTADNWYLSQTFTVTGVTAGTSTVSHSVTSTDSNFPSTLTLPQVVATVTTAAVPPSKLVLTTDALQNAAPESDGTVEVTATLDQPATSAVSVALTAAAASTAGSGDYMLPAAFTIPAGQKSASADVTLVDDGIDEDKENLVLTTTVSGLTVTGVTLQITDDDTAGVEVFDTSRTVTVGSDTTYTVKLTSQPRSAVTVTPTSQAPSKATVSGAVTFTSLNWSTAQTITVAGVAAGTAMVTHAVSGTAAKYPSSLTVDSVTVAVENAPAVKLSETTRAVNTGATTTYTAVLATAPTAAVTVTPTSDATSKATVSEALTFTTGNWATAQTFTVTGVAAGTATVTHSASSDDPDYGTSLTIASVAVTINTVPGVTLTPTTVSVVEGATATYTAVLDSQPTESVTVTATSGTTTKATVSEALTFTTGNWNTPQTFTVTGQDAGTSAITHAATSDDSNYQITTVGTVTATVTDAPGVTLSADTVSVVEGAKATYTAVLDTQPTADVTVTATSGTTTKATVSAALVFTTGNWNTPQTFTVTGIDAGTSAITHAATSSDSNYQITTVGTVTATVTAAPPTTLTLTTNANNNTVAENGGSVTVTATLNKAATSAVTVTLTATNASTAGSGDYSLPAAFSIPMGQTMATGTVSITNDDLDEDNETIVLTTSVSGLTVTGVTVTITDDDTHGVTVNKTSVNVVEDDTATYTVVLDSQPTANVVVAATSSATTKATVTAARTFTAANWDTAQTFTVTGQDAGTSSITHAATSGDAQYNGETVGTVSVTISNAPGVTLNPTTVSVAEGATATYTVVLDTQPTANVTVTATSGTIAKATVSAARTFTAANWDTAQSFTVTGQDAGTSAITHAATSTDSNYTITTIGTVTATVTATATAPTALTLTTNASSNTIAEGGSSVTVTATLNTAATSAVTVTLTATGTATSGSDYSLPAAFTIASGATTGTGTVSITNDDLDEDNETIILSTSVSGLTVTGVTVTITDNDTHGVTVNKTSVNVVEDDTATYTVVLDSQPTANVVVAATSSAIAKATVTAARTFTAANWSTPQTFTVSGVDAGTSSITHAATSSDSQYSGETVGSVSVTVTNAPGVTLNPTTVSVAEGSTATYTVVLDTQPTANVTVTATSGTTAKATVSAARTFTPSNWNTAQSFTVTGEDAGTSAITHAATSTDSNYTITTIGTVTATVTATATAPTALTLTTNASSNTIAEGGGSVTVTATLNTSATSAVTVTLTATNASTAGSGDYSLPAAFTIASGATVGTGTVSITNDDLDEDNETIILSATASGLTVTGVTVTITDNDTHGVTVSGTSVSVVEDDTATYTVVLDSQPTANVVVAATSSATTKATVTASRTFTVANWSTPQTFTVSGVDAGTSSITHAATSGDTQYNGETVAAVSVTISNAPGVTLNPTTVSVAEGSTATYTVVLDTQPTANVTVTATSGTTAKATVSAARTFTPSNWNTAQSFTVTGEDAGTSAITHAATSTDSNYTITTIGTVTATVTATATAPTALTLTTNASSNTIAEGGGSVTVTATLNTSATSPVTVTLTATNASTAGSGDYSLPAAFTIASGATTGTGTVSITNDDLDEDNETIILSATASGLNVTGVTVTITDNDTHGVTVSGTSVSAVEGSTATYTVVLDSQPTANVVVAATSSATTKATVTAARTFTAANWDTPQTFTVSGVEAGTSSITHAATSSDSQYNGETVGTVTATVTAAAAAPTALTLTTNASSNTVAEGGGSVTVTATLNTSATSAVTVTLTATNASTAGSGDYSLPAAFTIASGATTGTGTVSITNDDLDEGNETIILSATASGLNVTGVTVTITDNDTHGVTVSGTSVSVAEGSTATYTVVLDSQPTANVVVAATSSATAKATVTASRTFSASNWDTPQTFTVRGVDEGTSSITHAATSGDAQYNGETVAAVSVTVTAQTQPPRPPVFTPPVFIPPPPEPSMLVLTTDADDNTVGEDGGSVTVTATLDEAATSAVSVTLTATGTATADEDYTLPTAFTIAAGQTAASGTVQITDDETVEDSETIILTTTATGLTVTPATLTITDNDPADPDPGTDDTDADPDDGVDPGTGDVVFVRPVREALCESDATIEDEPFTDVPQSSFAYNDVACIFMLGVTTGTSATTYSPKATVTREQMASFLARLYEKLSGTPAPVTETPFTDVDETSFASDDISRIFGLGITRGTSSTTYSPKATVTREQMASFLARLYEQISGTPAPVTETPFTDVDETSFASADIGRIFGLGITTGTSSTTYSPKDPVTREQMATFLANLYRTLTIPQSSSETTP